MDGGPFIPAQSLGGFLSLLLGYSLEMRIHNGPRQKSLVVSPNHKNVMCSREKNNNSNSFTDRLTSIVGNGLEEGVLTPGALGSRHFSRKVLV